MYSKPHMFLIYFNIWWGYILVLILDRGNVMTEWWQNLLLGIIPAALTAIVSIMIAKKSHLRANTKAIEELSRRLGDFKEISLEQQIGVGVKNDGISSIASQLGIIDISITKQIGISKDEKSLTGQHKDIINLITADKEARAAALNKFNKRQKKILETTEEFKLFIEDWERKTTENNKLSEENEQLKLYIERLEEMGYEDENQNEQEF